MEPTLCEDRKAGLCVCVVVVVAANTRARKWMPGTRMTPNVAQKLARSGPVMHRLLYTTLFVSLVCCHCFRALSAFVAFGIALASSVLLCWLPLPVAQSKFSCPPTQFAKAPQ